jgi:ribosomal protein S1
MMECYEEQHPIEGIVKEIIPAGYILDLDLGFSTVSGFMPNTLGGVNRLHNPEALLNQRVNVMIENMNYDSGYFVVSRKKYLQSLIPEAIEKLTIGDKCEGWITGLSSYGAYVEFNECLTGLVHKMNMDEETIDKFNNRELKPGDVIDFYVTDICKGERIILAQHLRESLWNTIKDGDVFDGRVKLIKQFGALVELDFETVGLIAQNYMYKNNIRLVEGQEIKVSIVTINKDERKIFLKPII